MNDNNMLDKIRKSSEQVEVPKTLEPDAIEKKLNEIPNRTGGLFRRAPVYRWASMAAAVAVVFLTLGIYNGKIPGGGQSNKTYLGKTEEEIQTGGESVGEGAADADGEEREIADADKKAQSEEKAKGSASSGQKKAAIAHIKNYKELYEALQKYDYGEKEYAINEDIMAAEGSRDIASGEIVSQSEPGASIAETADVAKSSDEKAGGYSGTNTRTAGIDEGDIVKTDGDYIYILRQNEGIRIVDASSMKVVKELPLNSQDETFQEMYVDGGILLAISSQTKARLEKDEDSAYFVDSQDITTVYTYRISNPKKAVLKAKLEQTGYYKSSRKNGRYLYLFTGYSPSLPENPSEYEKFVPFAGGGMLDLTDIFIPKVCRSKDSLVISAIDTKKPDVACDTKSIVSGANDFYVSDSHIFITNGSYGEDGEKTQIMSFAYEGTTITPQAAGFIKGYLNDSFSIDEYKNHLRVVTTRWDEKDGIEQNGLYILDEDLKTVGKIEDIAPGETIQSARFMGDAGYFVTYRQMDPLFSVDLSDPKKPAILGELKITGFSEYLHFYGNGLLLGIGWETDPKSGAVKGLKLSMFDISDPSKVVEKDKTVLKGVSYCTALTNYKAVMIDPQKNLFGFFYQTEEQKGSKTNNIYSVFRYNKKQGFTNEFTYSLPQPKETDWLQAEGVRGLYIENYFYLLSGNTLVKFDMGRAYKTVKKLAF